jgi:c-di-GMP-related signal transduction protein
MEVFVARQPIFDAAREVVAYELLFRDGIANTFSGIDGTEATRQVVLNAFVLFGLQRLTAGRPAFINFTREALASDLATLFPPHAIVIEVLEDIRPEPEILAQLKSMRERGYALALDDVVQLEGLEEFVAEADIIKVDFRATTPEKRIAIARALRDSPTRLLAEKVETYEEFEFGVANGYALFQGYFFAKPEVMRRKDVAGNQAQYLRLLRELQQPEISFDDVDRIVRQDLALTYRLLKYINSSFFSLRSEIRSVRHALTLLGQKDVRRWATLAALSAAAEGKPAELVETGLMRARYCESLRPLLAERIPADELFLLGLFSILDACVDAPLEDALKEVAVPSRVKAALMGMPSELRTVLDTVLAFERGDWNFVFSLARDRDLAPDMLASLFLGSMDWARSACSAAVSSSIRP